MNAFNSSINTSSRSAGRSFLKSDLKTQLHPEQGDISSRLEVALALSTLTIIGPGIILLINEIFQTLFNEPKKREEQLEIACHVAFEKIESGENGKTPKCLKFNISTGNEIKYIENSDGVYVQHDNGTSKKAYDRSGAAFKTLDELQAFRRKDISDKKIGYEDFFKTEASKELFKKARLISTLSTTTIFEGAACLDNISRHDMKTLYNLTDKGIEEAYDVIQDALKTAKTAPPTLTGLDLLHLAIEPLFKLEKNWRYDQDSESIFFTSRNIYNLTNVGEEKIAAYYNKKYFVGKNNERKILVTKNDEDFKAKLRAAILDDSCRMAGFLFRVNPSADAHPTPIVFEKKNGKFHFFISDSMAFSATQCRAIVETLKEFPGSEHEIYISVASADGISRQADNGSCHSDALYYVQRALRRGSMLDHEMVAATSTKNSGYDTFKESADLLLTAQTSSVLKQNGIADDSVLKLGQQGRPKTFNEKISGHNDPVEYFERDDNRVKKMFKNRGFLSHINQKHHSILMSSDRT